MRTRTGRTDCKDDTVTKYDEKQGNQYLLVHTTQCS